MTIIIIIIITLFNGYNLNSRYHDNNNHENIKLTLWFFLLIHINLTVKLSKKNKITNLHPILWSYQYKKQISRALILGSRLPVGGTIPGQGTLRAESGRPVCETLQMVRLGFHFLILGNIQYYVFSILNVSTIVALKAYRNNTCITMRCRTVAAGVVICWWRDRSFEDTLEFSLII